MQPVPSRYETRQSLLMRIHQHEECGWLEFTGPLALPSQRPQWRKSEEEEP